MMSYVLFATPIIGTIALVVALIVVNRFMPVKRVSVASKGFQASMEKPKTKPTDDSARSSRETHAQSGGIAFVGEAGRGSLVPRGEMVEIKVSGPVSGQYVVVRQRYGRHAKGRGMTVSEVPVAVGPEKEKQQS